MTIPKQFIRIWLGPKPIPEQFEKWWSKFKQLHPDWDFITLRDTECKAMLPRELVNLYENASCYAAQSDIARYVAVNRMGGIYVDTDVMPLRPMDSLLEDESPFAAKRSSRSFESAVFGGPAQHPAFQTLIVSLPEWYKKHEGRAASVQTGPAFFSSVMFGRADVRHLPSKTFYPYNGFMAPKRDQKHELFNLADFPEEMLCAHFSNHNWGGKPKK